MSERIRSAKALGVLAVVGLVIAFSLSSTLVKRAESPGVLVAFWRLLIVTVLWNLVLAATGRRVTMQNVRQVVVPGVLFGLNLAVFFAGATHNSVANAALIGSLAPFLIVPVGAWLFDTGGSKPRRSVPARDVPRIAGRRDRGAARSGRLRSPAAGRRPRRPGGCCFAVASLNGLAAVAQPVQCDPQDVLGLHQIGGWDRRDPHDELDDLAEGRHPSGRRPIPAPSREALAGRGERSAARAGRARSR